jgi:hypothetical protein
MTPAVKKLKLESVVDFIHSGLSESELQTINYALQCAWKIRQRTAAYGFRVGDRVMFESRKGPFGGMLVGTVSKVNSKTVRVNVDTRNGVREPVRNWVVTSTLLKKV